MTDWITPEQATEHLPRFNAAWYRDQLRKGKLRGSQVNGRWFTKTEFIDEMVEAGTNSTRRRRRREVA